MSRLSINSIEQERDDVGSELSSVTSTPSFTTITSPISFNLLSNINSSSSTSPSSTSTAITNLSTTTTTPLITTPLNSKLNNEFTVNVTSSNASSRSNSSSSSVTNINNQTLATSNEINDSSASYRSPSPLNISSKDATILTQLNENVEKKSKYSSTEKTFHRRFSQVNLNETLLNYFSCALVADILLQGFLYISENYFAFYSNIFGYKTKILIPISEVTSITKEKTVKIIPNAVGINTSDHKYVFGSLLSRETTYRILQETLSKHISLFTVNKSNETYSSDQYGENSLTNTTKGDLNRIEGNRNGNGNTNNNSNNNNNNLTSTPIIIVNNNNNDTKQVSSEVLSKDKMNAILTSDTESDINSTDEDSKTLNKNFQLKRNETYSSSFKYLINGKVLLYLSIAIALIILLIFSIILLWRINNINKSLNYNSNQSQQSLYLKEEVKRINFQLINKFKELSQLRESLTELLSSLERLTSCNSYTDQGTLTSITTKLDDICLIQN